MPKSPETMIHEWKKVTDTAIVAQAAIALNNEGADVISEIYSIPSQNLGGEAAGETIREILSQVPNIETFDYNAANHIDAFVEAVVGLAEDATIHRYSIEHFVEEEFIGSSNLSTYSTRDALEKAGFTFDEGTATPPANPLTPSA